MPSVFHDKTDIPLLRKLDASRNILPGSHFNRVGDIISK